MGGNALEHLGGALKARQDCSHGGLYCVDANPGEINIAGPIALNVTHPLPGTQTLPDLPIFVEILITDFSAMPEDWAERFEICVTISSDHFATKEFDCLPLSTPELRVSSLPYGQHFLHVYIQHQNLGIVVDTMNVIPMTTVPILWPRHVSSPGRHECFDGLGPSWLEIPSKQSVPIMKLHERGQTRRDPETTTSGETTPDLLPITICVLVHRAATSLKAAAESWITNGLFEMVRQRVIFVQELDYQFQDGTFGSPPFLDVDANNTKFQSLQRMFSMQTNVSIIPSPSQVHITGGLISLVENSNSDFVLFLEEDWVLLESKDNVRRQLEEGIRRLRDKVHELLCYCHQTSEEPASTFNLSGLFLLHPGNRCFTTAAP